MHIISLSTNLILCPSLEQAKSSRNHKRSSLPISLPTEILKVLLPSRPPPPPPQPPPQPPRKRLCVVSHRDVQLAAACQMTARKTRESCHAGSRRCRRCSSAGATEARCRHQRRCGGGAAAVHALLGKCPSTRPSRAAWCDVGWC